MAGGAWCVPLGFSFFCALEGDAVLAFDVFGPPATLTMVFVALVAGNVDGSGFRHGGYQGDFDAL
jgi:hypothetical protein